MDIKAKKLDLIEWLLQLKDEAMLEKVYNLKEDTPEEIPEAVKKSIEIALEQARQGKVSPHEEVMERMRAKFNIKR